MSAFTGAGGSMRLHRARKQLQAEQRNAAYRQHLAAAQLAANPLLGVKPARDWREYDRTHRSRTDADCPTCHKRAYRDRGHARQAARDLHDKGLRAYRCPAKTGGWHIGHLQPLKREGRI